MNAQNHNRYSYCLNSPLKFTDPSGYCLSILERRGKREYEGFFFDNMLNDRMEWLNSGGGSYKYDFMCPGYTNWVAGGTQENQETQGVTIIYEATITYVLLNPGSISKLRELANDGVNYVEIFEDGDTSFGTNWIDPVYCFGKKPKGTSGQGGDPYSLYFDGNRLMVVDENTGSVTYSTLATSGKGEHMNNPASQNIQNLGPIPQGNYTINNTNWSHQSTLRQIYNIVAGYGDWGDYNVPLIPTTYQGPRNSFYLHGGFFEGSAGCIDAGQNIGNIYNVLNTQMVTTLRVRY